MHLFQHTFLYQHHTYHTQNFYSIWTLGYPSLFMHIKFLCLNYVLPNTIPFGHTNLTFFFHFKLLWTNYILPHISPTHSFRSPIMENLYPLPTLSKSFQSLFLIHHLYLYGWYTTIKHTFFFTNSNFLHSILEVAHPSSTISLWHNSHSETAPKCITISFSCTPTHISFTSHYVISLFFFNFASPMPRNSL